MPLRMTMDWRIPSCSKLRMHVVAAENEHLSASRDKSLKAPAKEQLLPAKPLYSSYVIH